MRSIHDGGGELFLVLSLTSPCPIGTRLLGYWQSSSLKCKCSWKKKLSISAGISKLKYWRLFFVLLLGGAPFPNRLISWLMAFLLKASWETLVFTLLGSLSSTPDMTSFASMRVTRQEHGTQSLKWMGGRLSRNGKDRRGPSRVVCMVFILWGVRKHTGPG